MEGNKYLNEGNYQKAEKKIKLVALIILVLGLCVGGFLIYKGVTNPGAAKAAELGEKLEARRKELEDNGVQFSAFATYTDGDAYDLKIITRALDPSFNYCSSDEYKNNALTKDYCSAKNASSSYASTALIIVGGVICFITLMISGSVYMISKGRKVLSFTTQQFMPVAKEGLEEMSPYSGKVAEEITKGIKRGLGK